MTGSEGDGRSVDVLLVEDSPGDVRLTQEAFREANQSIKLHVAVDGVEAMAFLRREGLHARAARPDLILLDLNMPRMDGREVLAKIKADDSLKMIPTVILTTSEGKVTSSRVTNSKRTPSSPSPSSWTYSRPSLQRSMTIG
jgi:CheY-like chemotaxis protein